jgi:hypothetical protein
MTTTTTHHALSLGLRRYAVTALLPVAEGRSHSGDEWSNSDQRWTAAIWERIEGRAYVCRLVGGGQWANRGDHGTYLGTGSTAEAALLAAWKVSAGDDYLSSTYGRNEDCPQDLIAPMRDYDAKIHPPDVE